MTFKTFVVFLIVGAAVWGYGADGQCTGFPTELQSGSWISSDFGTVTFNGTHMSASSLVDFGALEFECNAFHSDFLYMLSSNFTFLGSSLRVGVCWKLARQSSTKYLYYPATPVLVGTATHRIMLKASTYTFDFWETCSLWNVPVSASRIRLLIQEGSLNVSNEECSSNQLAGNFHYSANSSCQVNETWMDVCTDKTQLITNYTKCSRTMFFSAGGVLSCVYSFDFGTMSYTWLYNEDASTDESTYYRYTCLVTTTVYDTRFVSWYPRACMENQTHLVVDAPGIYGELYPNSTCATSTSDDDSVLAAGAVAAIILALLILGAAGVVVGIWYYIKVYRIKKVSPDGMPSTNSPPIDTKEQQKLDGRVSPFSPYPTVSELAVYRFGSSPPPEIDDDDGGMTLEATTPGFTEGRRTIYDKEADRESMTSLPVYSEVGGETPDPTRLSEVQTRMSEVSEANIADPTPWTMTRATMNIPEETSVSPIQSPTGNKENGDINDVAL